MKIRAIHYEQNPAANSLTCNNGGGYFQPLYILHATDDNGTTLWKAEISDKDCGEFGDEVGATIAVDGTLYECWYGTRTEGNAYSNIPYDKCKDILETIHSVIGYSLPVKNDEWCWEQTKKGDIDINHLIDEITKDYASSVAYGYDLDPDTPYTEWFISEDSGYIDDDDDEEAYQPWMCEWPPEDEDDEDEDEGYYFVDWYEGDEETLASCDVDDPEPEPEHECEEVAE